MIRPVVLAAVLVVLPAAYAQTVSLQGADLDLRYEGAGIVVESAVLDDIGSVDLDVSVDDVSTLRVTIPESVFGSMDPSRVDVLANFAPVQFDTVSSDSGLIVSIQVDVTTRTVQIIYDDVSGSSEPERPPGAPPVQTPPEEVPPTETPPGEVSPPEPPTTTPPGEVSPPEPPTTTPPQAVSPPAETPPEPEIAESAIRCGEGTYLEDGACVPSCGPGLVLQGQICVVASAPASPANTRADLVYGAAAGFAVAFAVMIVLWIMARASRHQHA